MPIYLCQAGKDEEEPWRHGIEVFGEIFDITGGAPSEQEMNGVAFRTSSPTDQMLRESRDTIGEENDEVFKIGRTAIPSTEVTRKPEQSRQHNPIRRIRHAEVVLVDDVCLKFGHYWLRLKSPGEGGGFAGYVCLPSGSDAPTTTAVVPDSAMLAAVIPSQSSVSNDDPIEPVGDDAAPVPAPSLPPNDPQSSPSPGAYTANNDNRTLRCLRTGIVFPSNPLSLKLLPSYDDGLDPPVSLPRDGNPVFCRICREGLHEDTAPGGAEDSNGDNGENPLMAPCECIGSMAFVHYLCVEQWRCRSRHPEANDGLNCETCFKPYALPPPSRPRPSPHPDEDWLEAMPPHVMAALREPHFWWRLGAAMVRRRWLRPVAPILLSPLVSLYCRARRLLKKRGVSRRRWACSLCRRRARWKCVRCLRSYYCSRHCQNVSWHIVHKHVCYKPARFWWSVVVYGALLLLAVPGILRDPLVYDFILFLIPASFYLVAILGGGIATLVKRTAGVDLRGRILESAVVVVTLWVLWITQGLVWAFFGAPASCVGVLGEAVPRVTLQTRLLVQLTRAYFVYLDKIMLYNKLFARFFCTSEGPNCFLHTPVNNPLSTLAEYPTCGGDYVLVSWLWFAAGVTLFVSTLWKKRRRNRVHQD